MSEQQHFPPPPVGDGPPAMPPRQEQQQYYPPPPIQETGQAVHSESEQQHFPSPPESGAPLPAQHAQEQGQLPAYNEQASFPAQHDQKQDQIPGYIPQDYSDRPVDQQHLYPPPPPKRLNRYSGEHDIASPIHYTRDPKKLIAYLIPFPKPHLPNISQEIPQRFLIYTPPPPPFIDKPKEGEKESNLHKAQRKWQEEIRSAKTGSEKLASWKGVKGKAMKGIDWGMSQTKGSNIEFLNRFGGHTEAHAEGSSHDDGQTQATVKVEEMVLVYPSSVSGTPEEIRAEFINTMLRSKTKAQRDAVIATGLLPVSAAIDIMLTFIWPFGGLLEIDSVWAYASIRGAKASRSMTKRLASTSTSGKPDDDMLHLNFTPSPRIAVLEQYVASRCHDRAADMFPSVTLSPTETEVLEAIGWFPSSKGGMERNWEDEQWEISEVKDDLKTTLSKGAREWEKWCRLFEKQPEKALKK